MKPLLNLDEPVQRQSGEPARIIERNAMGVYPLVALVTLRGGIEQVVDRFTSRGEKLGASVINGGEDLINVPKRVEDGAINLRCFLMKNGEIQVCVDSISCLQGSSDVLGSTSTRVFVKRGSWT